MKENKKVLVLLIGEVLEDPRVLKTCRSLTSAGAAVTAACTNPSGRLSHEDVEGFSIIRFPHPVESLPKRLYSTFEKKSGTAGETGISKLHEREPSSQIAAKLRTAALNYNFRHYLRSHSRVAGIMADALKKNTYDLVHCNDLDTLAAGVSLKKSGAVRALLYDSHEYWAGVGRIESQNRALFALEHSLIGQADFVVTVNPLIAERLREEHGLLSLPAVVMNCPEANPGQVTLSAHEPVKIIFQGKLQAYRGLETLIRSMALFDGAVLTISGYGPLEARLRTLAGMPELAGKVTFTGRYRYEEAPGILAGHDIGVIPYEDVVLNNRYSSPNKLFEYLMASLAVVSGRLPFLESFILDNRVGAVFPEATPEGIAGTLANLIADRTGLAALKAHAGTLARENYTWERQFEENYPWTVLSEP